MDSERPPNLRTVGLTGEDTAATGAQPLAAPFGVNTMAELVVDLLAATNLVSPDKLALVRGRAGQGSLAQAIVDEGVAPPEGIARSLAVRYQISVVDLALDRRREGSSRADPAARAGARRRDPVRARGGHPARRRRRSGQPARARRASARDPLPARPRRRLERGHPRRAAPDGARLGGVRHSRGAGGGRCRPRHGRGGRHRRPRGRGRGLRRAARSARQLRHLPGRRGRRLRRPLRAAGGRARRPLPRRRRAPGGATDPEADDAGRDDPPEGAREARHRRAAEAAGRPHLPERRRSRPHARHPCRDAAHGRGREGRHASPRQVEAGTDAGGARALGRHARQARGDHREADRRAPRHRADRLR